LAVAFPPCVILAGIAENQYPRGFPGRLFLWGALPGVALGFPASGYAVLPQPPLFCRVALSAVTAKRGGFGRLFCPWRPRVSRRKVALGLGLVAVSPACPFLFLTLHSRGTGR